MLSVATARVVALALFEGAWTYGCELWGPIEKGAAAPFEVALNRLVRAVLGGNGDSAAAPARAEIGWGSCRLFIIEKVLTYWGRVSSLGDEFPVHCLLRKRMQLCIDGNATCKFCQRFIDAAQELWGRGSQHRLLQPVRSTSAQRSTAREMWKKEVRSRVQAACQREFEQDCSTTAAGKRYLQIKAEPKCAQYFIVVRELPIWRCHSALQLLTGLRTGDHGLRSADADRRVPGASGNCECGARETAEHFLVGCGYTAPATSDLLGKLYTATHVDLRASTEWDCFVQIMRWVDGGGLSDSAVSNILVIVLEHICTIRELRASRMDKPRE